jgi:hypothetical protein
MNIDSLREQFIVDDDVLKSRLESLVAKALKHCRVDKKGQVLVTASDLSGRDQVKLVLAARGIAVALDESIRSEVSVAEIGKFTGLPGNQVRARVKECIEQKFAESCGTGIYRAMPYKIEAFLDSLAPPATEKK